MNREVREKADPEVEFSSDPMMKELHNIQMKITKQVKNMGGKELSDFFKKERVENR